MNDKLKSVLVSDTVIGQLLTKFSQGDTSMFDHIAQDIDFKIDHFRDEADVSWQSANSLEALAALVDRLGKEVFPKGTEVIGINTHSLGNGWYLTCFNQRFFYGIRGRNVTSLTYILSHEINGKVDFFRETVTNVVDV